MRKSGRLSLFSLLLACAATTPLTAAEPPSYSKQVRPFLTRYCSECHNAKDVQGGLNLESYAALMEGGQHGPVLVAGKADASRIVGQVEGKTEADHAAEEGRAPADAGRGRRAAGLDRRRGQGRRRLDGDRAAGHQAAHARRRPGRGPGVPAGRQTAGRGRLARGAADRPDQRRRRRQAARTDRRRDGAGVQPRRPPCWPSPAGSPGVDGEVRIYKTAAGALPPIRPRKPSPPTRTPFSISYSARTARRWPPAATTGSSSCGTWKPAS